MVGALAKRLCSTEYHFVDSSATERLCIIQVLGIKNSVIIVIQTSQSVKVDHILLLHL